MRVSHNIEYNLNKFLFYLNNVTYILTLLVLIKKLLKVSQ